MVVLGLFLGKAKLHYLLVSLVFEKTVSGMMHINKYDDFQSVAF